MLWIVACDFGFRMPFSRKGRNGKNKVTHARPELNQQFSKPLHGIRGIAACIVVLGHVSNIVLSHDGNFHMPPGLFNGSASVVLFFVLSGLVLSPSALKASANPTNMIGFYIRRAFRLMPLMVVVNIASGVFVAGVHPMLPYLEPLTGPFRLDVFLVGFVGATIKMNGPSWSIFVEIVASALMPFLAVAAASRFRVLWLAIVALVACLPVPAPYQLQIYLVPFFVGACIPFVLSGNVDVLRSSPIKTALASMVFLFLFYVSRITFHNAFPAVDVNTSPVVVMAETVFVAPVIALMFATSWPRILGARIFQLLGDLSFPLYLLHFNILTAVYNGVRVAGVDQGWAVFLLSAIFTFLITLPLSWLVNVYVELPGIAAGKKVADFVNMRFRARAL